MELALHLRSPGQMKSATDWVRHLAGFYPDEASPESFFVHAEGFHRIYMGDEFCFHRLPTEDGIRRFCRLAETHHLNVTLLTPPMTDPLLRKGALLFTRLENDCPGAEVVANDPGVLSYLRNHHSGLRSAAGRLLNKGFKDPRLTLPENEGAGSEAMLRMLNDSTFCQEAVLVHLFRNGAKRFEQDLMPCASGFNPGDLKMKTSVYFPFGYVTTGRLCQIASRSRRGRQRFLIADRCAQPCDHYTQVLTHNSFRLKVLQNGNTIYYLYSPAMLKNLFKTAAGSAFRLVYQGLAF